MQVGRHMLKVVGANKVSVACKLQITSNFWKHPRTLLRFLRMTLIWCTVSKQKFFRFNCDARNNNEKLSFGKDSLIRAVQRQSARCHRNDEYGTRNKLAAGDVTIGTLFCRNITMLKRLDVSHMLHRGWEPSTSAWRRSRMKKILYRSTCMRQREAAPAGQRHGYICILSPCFTFGVFSDYSVPVGAKRTHLENDWGRHVAQNCFCHARFLSQLNELKRAQCWFDD